MSDDLISRSALIKEIASVEWWNIPATKVVSKFNEIIKNQPTAYNVDKVVEQLKTVSTCSDPSECYGDCKTCQYADLVYKDIAIDMVKAGGVNE